jgi:hypothetical protein
MGRSATSELQDCIEDGQTTEEGGVTVKIDGKEFHLGYSRLAAYIDCPKAYELSYVKGIRTEGTPVMRRGTALHNVFEDMLKWKAGYETLMPMDKAKLSVVKHCKELKVCDSATKEVNAAVEYFYEKLYGDLTPALLLDTAPDKETPIEGSFKIVRGGVEIQGRIDFAAEYRKGQTICTGIKAQHEGGVIHDWKFSNKPWDEDRITHSVQPMIYQWAGIDWFEPNFGIPYLGFQYDVFNVWPEVQIQTVYIPRLDKKASDWWEHQVEKFAKAIRSGVFPATPSSSVCKWCNHRAHCKPTIYTVHIGFVKSSDGVDF